MNHRKEEIIFLKKMEKFMVITIRLINNFYSLKNLLKRCNVNSDCVVAIRPVRF